MPPGRPDISGPTCVTTAISLAVHSAERGVCHNQRNFGSRSLRERRRSRLIVSNHTPPATSATFAMP